MTDKDDPQVLMGRRNRTFRLLSYLPFFLRSLRTGIEYGLHNIFEWYELSYFEEGADQKTVDMAYADMFSWIYDKEISIDTLHKIVLAYYRQREWLGAKRMSDLWEKE